MAGHIQFVDHACRAAFASSPVDVAESNCYTLVSMRVVSNSFLALLLLSALLWGNCLSCPQLLLNLASQVPAHDCCKHPGKQPVGCQTTCQSLALKHFVKADPAPTPQLHAVAYAHFLSADAMPLAPAAPKAAVVVIAYSPPDLEVLNSSFRI